MRTLRFPDCATPWSPALVASMLCLALSTATLAQEPQPIVLVHGFISDGSTWASAEARLRGEFNVRPTRPTLPWGHAFNDQTQVLRSSVAAAPWAYPDTTVFVGHSNGGLISRELNRQGQPMKAIVTVGTLHQGAPLALTMGVLPAWGGFIFAENASPIYYYLWWLGDYNWISWIASSQAAVMASAGAFMTGFGSWVLDRAMFGALPDMQPGSDFLSNRVNTPGNLAREAASIPARVGIQSYLDNSFYGVMFHGILGSGGGADVLTAIQYSSIIWDFIAFDYYSSFWWSWDDPWAWDKAMGAYLWLNAAYTTAAIDPVWCVLAGVATPYGCEPSDGIVPLRNQYYPGGQNYTVRGPAHTDETSSRTTLDQLSFVLRYSVGVGAPVYVPPPPYEPPPYEPPCAAAMIVCPVALSRQPAPIGASSTLTTRAVATKVRTRAKGALAKPRPTSSISP
jgi:pimeloyl-ACP methyl ester carboxylesterase